MVQIKTNHTDDSISRIPSIKSLTHNIWYKAYDGCELIYVLRLGPDQALKIKVHSQQMHTVNSESIKLFKDFVRMPAGFEITLTQRV